MNQDVCCGILIGFIGAFALSIAYVVIQQHLAKRKQTREQELRALSKAIDALRKEMYDEVGILSNRINDFQNRMVDVGTCVDQISDKQEGMFQLIQSQIIKKKTKK